jgi:predicted dehydrogenase
VRHAEDVTAGSGGQDFVSRQLALPTPAAHVTTAVPVIVSPVAASLPLKSPVPGPWVVWKLTSDPSTFPDTGCEVRHAEPVTTRVPLSSAPDCWIVSVYWPLPAGAVTRTHGPFHVPDRSTVLVAVGDADVVAAGEEATAVVDGTDDGGALDGELLDPQPARTTAAVTARVMSERRRRPSVIREPPSRPSPHGGAPIVLPGGTPPTASCPDRDVLRQDARMSDRIRWGVIGTGLIASRFAGDLVLLDDAEVVAVGSRAQETADAFGDRFSVPHRHASYEALVEDSEVDAVYVSTPHPGHHAATRLALEAGKAVLCEKPFMLNAAEADDVITLARERRVFLMEAMWTRFLPHMVRLREILAAGTLGRLVGVQADHGQWFPYDVEHRLFAPSLGGGALLDLGVYPVSFASSVLGPPTSITAVSDPAETGVDGQTTVVLRCAGATQAVLTTTLWAVTPCRATVVGTDARVEVDPTWYVPTSFTVLSRHDEVLERFDEPRVGHGLRYQAAEVGRCLREGLTESPVLPLDESRSVMVTMDEVRRQVALTYPGEDAPGVPRGGRVG